MCAYLLSCVLFATLWMRCSLLGFSVHGSFQARILEWGAISSSRESSQPRDRTQVSSIADRFLPTEPSLKKPGDETKVAAEGRS